MSDKKQTDVAKTGVPDPARQADTMPTAPSGAAAVDAFVRHARAMATPNTGGKRGRLIFALDATMSRQPTWDAACQMQADMFLEAGRVGGLDIQLVYFRGFNECRSSRWASDAEALARMMTRITVRGGHTQIGKVLAHARKEFKKDKVGAMVYVGDCCEEPVDTLCHQAGELGLLGLPVFVFQEGHEPHAERTFREIARLSGGAYCRFDSGSAAQLRELLRAAAVYAAGGHQALEDYSAKEKGESVKLIAQLRK